MKLFINYIKADWNRTLWSIVAKCAGAVGELLIPVILATLIDEIAMQQDVWLAARWGGYMVLVAVLTYACNFLGNYLATAVSGKAGRSIRKDLFEKIVYLSAAQIDRVTVASLETRMTSDTYNIQQVITMTLRMGIRAPVLLLGGVFLAFMMDSVLALLLLVMMPIIFAVVFVIAKRGLSLYGNVQKGEDAMASCVRENVLGIRIIKALAAKDFETAKFAEINTDLTNSDIKATANMVLSNPLANMILNIASALVVFFGASRVMAGHCDVGVLLAFITYFTIILNALMSISRIFIMTTKGVASGNRIQEVLDCEQDLLVCKKKEKIDAPYIYFDNVSFSYQTEETDEHTMNLTDITIGLEKGQTLGILGATGSGKSTLLLLLMRFYDVAKGGIYINGVNVKSMSLETLHKKFGVTLQSDYLFSDSILENICFGRQLEEQEVKEAVKVAQAENFVYAYEENLDHKLAIKGSNLSGGQKQRLLIARAVAASPEILILDDSSSALDYKTDSLLRQELQKIESDTTTILVAQRISSVKEADVIVILDEGKVVDMGKHDELMQRCKMYQDLSAHQLGVMGE